MRRTSKKVAHATTATMTAEAFAAGIVHLVQSHQIHTVELLTATVEHQDEGAAVLHRSSFPILIVVDARLTSALAWQHDSQNRKSIGKTTDENGTIFTYQVTFLLLGEERATDARSVGAAATAASTTCPQTVLSAWWCVQLQRRLAICSALIGLPSRLHVSLLPYVPILTWEKDRDGILGAMHSATMMSTLSLRDKDDDEAAPGYLLQVALLLNANIPLGQRGGHNTAVLLLHAVDGDACFASSSITLTSHNQRKRRRQSEHAERGPASDVTEETQLFPLLMRFSETHLLPEISWETVWSRRRPSEKEHEDVCGLREQLGFSFYLDGALDAGSVQSITIIVNAPLCLWSRVLLSSVAVHLELSTESPLKQLSRCIANTVDGALSRLAADNIDCFLRRAAVKPSAEVGKGEDDAMGSGPGLQSWMLLAQSIADSLARIVRTSQNRAFVTEVDRLLHHHRMEGNMTRPHPVGEDTPTAIPAVVSSVATTASLLRWAVEARLMER
ncbi:hypothetical protein DQ04_00011250 [Trypanosoma grayi]|uniref:hypothetical protein n=1 Tax=Trypanosoma grayi TaxID=71804 RepID=UPI0004F4953B|nr:hypothetical protein DQ04_00011250 [Trypanosoma grayi]KEG15658.1 hypothetical protein DQ04_00011250 [Trypanosoma grayi]